MEEDVLIGQNYAKGHPSAEVLELYALGRLAESSAIPAEEHLLVCDDCQDRLAEADAYVSAMKQGCLDAEGTRPRPSLAGVLSGLFAVPKPVFAVALTLGFLCSVTIPMWTHRVPIGPEMDISLAASRGIPESNPLSAANRPLHLTIDLSQLAPYPSYRVSVIRGDGSTVWQDSVRPDRKILSFRLPKPILSGLYWVRLSSPAAEPLQEFSLHVQ